MEEKEGDALQAIMQEPQVMYAYEGPLTDEEVRTWLNRQLERCARFGFGLWAVILKETGRVVGQCGLTMQLWKKESVLKISYLFRWDAWHRGYATEAAQACREHAFSVPGVLEVCSIVRDTNLASQNVPRRNGMPLKDTWVKRFRGDDMPHIRLR